jgi:alpha-galactosidase
MDFTPENPAARMIWDHDNEVLQAAIDFYKQVEDIIGTNDFVELDKALKAARAPKGVDKEQCQQLKRRTPVISSATMSCYCSHMSHTALSSIT